MRLLMKLPLTLPLILATSFSQAQLCMHLFKSKEDLAAKSKIKQERNYADRNGGVVQITGKDLVHGQTEFPNRTPADPIPFTDTKTGHVFVYGTQVDGTGFSYLEFKNMNDMLRGAPLKIVAKDVYLPNGKLLRGKEAIWDTNRLSYDLLKKVFSEDVLSKSYAENNVDPKTDLYFGGVALQEDGNLGRWTTDNWRRRIHPLVEISGKLSVLKSAVFNRIESGKTEGEKSFGGLPFLPGDYIGHAYGPNFKLVRNKSNQLELWIINEEVTRRVQDGDKMVEATEIVARRMISPFEASSEMVTLISVDTKDGTPHPDTNRGPEMGNTKLLEGFRHTDMNEEGIRITKRAVRKNGRIVLVDDPTLAADEYFIMTGSPSNFAGDVYDALIAVSKGSAIAPYHIITEKDGFTFKKFLKRIKSKYDLSWAGRASFAQLSKDFWLLFHAVDKDIRPNGSYGGVIPKDTQKYHRNIYGVPVEFFIGLDGKPDMMVLD